MPRVLVDRRACNEQVGLNSISASHQPAQLDSVLSSLEGSRIQPLLRSFLACPFLSLAIDLPSMDSFDLFVDSTEFPTIRELFIGGRDTLHGFVVAHGILQHTQQTSLPRLERLITGCVSWAQHNDPVLQRRELSRDSLAQRFEAMLESRPFLDASPVKYIRFIGSINLNGWDPLSLKEAGLVEEVEEEDHVWSSAYICECHRCHVYLGLEDEEGIDTEEDVE